MMYLISKNHRGQECQTDLEAMYRLRYRVFKERLKWDVSCHDGMEQDEYDCLDPVYLVHRNRAGVIDGCIRMLPTTGPNMLRDTFPQLSGDAPTPATPLIWESSRFALDAEADLSDKSPVGLSTATHELFAGMIEFGLAWGLRHIVTVTDVRVQRILKRAGWPLEAFTGPQPVGNTKAVAGLLETSQEALMRVREIGGLNRPVLWIPATFPAAA